LWSKPLACDLTFSAACQGRISGKPRHFLLYRRRADGSIEVARIPDDALDLERHLPEGHRQTIR
jgi:plasmid stabilization system protein ParE